jgi:heme oxygenase
VDANNIMLRLRNETAGQHESAENRPYEQALIKGAVSRPMYVAGLGQRLCVHRRLENHLRQAATREPRIAAVLDDVQFQAPNAEVDLRYFGVDPAQVSPLPPTAKYCEFIDNLAATNPIALLGCHYVFEGSKNGARFIARALRGPLRLEGGQGLQYQDPHGDQQRPIWDDFKQRMLRIEFSAADQEAMIAAARQTFDAIGEIDDAVFAAHS